MNNTDTEQQDRSADMLSLSQAILAPLDAIFKAQIHAGRSYINMLWQMAYPHLPVDANGRQIPFKNAYKDPEGKYVFEDSDGNMFSLDDKGNKIAAAPLTTAYMTQNKADLHLPYQFPISFQVQNGDEVKEYVMQVPAITMVPSSPLGIEEANVNFQMSINHVEDHKQMKSSEGQNYKASNDGDGFNESKRPWYLVERPKSIVGSISSGSTSSTDSKIDISIKLTKSPVPAALEKSLTMLTQAIFVKEESKPNS